MQAHWPSQPEGPSGAKAKLCTACITLRRDQYWYRSVRFLPAADQNEVEPKLKVSRPTRRKLSMKLFGRDEKAGHIYSISL